MAAPYGAQPQYQQQAQQQPQYQQQAQQQPQYQQQAQQQQYQPPPVAMAPVEEEKRSNVALIIGIIGGVIAILGLAAFFVLGPDLGLGGDEEPETAQAAKDQAPVPTVGGLELTLTPADAMVKVDGKEYPGQSPRTIGDLSVGKHTIEVSKGEKFLPLTQEVTVGAGKALSLPLALQLRDVTLEIKVSPPAALITLLAGTTPTKIGKDAASHKHALKRQPGVDYTLEAVAEGYADASVPVVFTGEATQPVTVTLVKQAPAADPTPTAEPEPEPKPKVAKKKTKKRHRPAKPKNAELKIGVAPGNPPAAVYVDGRKQSKKAPVFVKVTAGRHTVKWKWDDGTTDTQKVSVDANQSKLLKGSK